MCTYCPQVVTAQNTLTLTHWLLHAGRAVCESAVQWTSDNDESLSKPRHRACNDGLLNGGGGWFNNHLLSLGFASGGFTSSLLGSGHCVEQNVLLLEATLEKSPNQGCQVFIKLTQLLPKTSPIAFRMGSPIKNCVLEYKMLVFFGGVPLVNSYFRG